MGASHKATIVMRPTASFMNDQTNEELNMLLEKRKSMTELDIQNLVSFNTKLKEFQEKEHCYDCLPTLAVADIDPYISSEGILEYDIVSDGRIDLPIQWLGTRTNEICYIRATFDSTHLPESLKPLLPLFSSCLTQLGTTKYDHRQISTELDRICGGISFAPTVLPHLGDPSFDQVLLMETMCLGSNVNHTLELLSDICNSANFSNHDQLTSIILMNSNSADSSIAQSGHALATSFASSRLTGAAALEEQYSGIEQVLLLRRIVDKMKLGTGEVDNDEVANISRILENISRRLFQPKHMKWSIVSEPYERQQNIEGIRKFSESLTVCDVPAIEFNYIQPRANSDVQRGAYFASPISINFVAQCLPTVPMLHEDYAPLSIMGQILQARFLHKKIREMGGAYGSFSSQVCWQEHIFLF